MLQVSFHGLSEGSSIDVASAREEFAQTRCLFLKQFLDLPVQERIKGMIDKLEYYTRIDLDTEGKVFARELTLDERHPLAWLMFMLLNQDALFDAIQAITGSETPFRYFRSRVYEFSPNPDHYDSWHDDDEKDQTIGLSVNLSPAPIEGGEFEIRDANSLRVLKKVSGSQFGDAHIFQIGPEYQHRVLPVTGKNGRLSCAGWFCPKPDFRSEMKEILRNRMPSNDPSSHAADTVG